MELRNKCPFEDIVSVLTIYHAEKAPLLKTEHGSCGTVPFIQETL
jgi:hypothetical protein